MPRYFFDVSDTGQTIRDSQGTELPDIEAARTEALAALGGIAKTNYRTAIKGSSWSPFTPATAAP